MHEHLKEQLAGMYDIHDPSSLRRGATKVLWRGMYGGDREESLEEYVRRLPKLSPALACYIQMIRFYIAPLRAGRRLLERVEAAIVDHLRSRKRLYHEMFEGVRYRARRRGERPLCLRCTWPRQLLGVPRRLEV